MNTQCVKTIEKLSDAFGPSGFEDDVVDIIKEQVEKLGTVQEDCLRNLYLYRKENTGNKSILMLDAHTDEVGFMIHSIKPDGTLKFVLLGGWNRNTLQGTRVLIKNKSNTFIKGIIVGKPPHLIKRMESLTTQQNENELYIDIGARSSEEVKDVFQIERGAFAAPEGFFLYDVKNGLLFGKAFDCRIGCAALIETLKLIEGKTYPFDIVATFTSQEEVGDRGCKLAVNRVQPQIAICFEGAPADDVGVESSSIQTAIKKGLMFRYMDKSIICNPRFMRFILNVAEEEHLPVQTSVRENGGNNGSAIYTAANGVPVVVAGIPVRHIHSAQSIAAMEDFNCAVCIVVKVIERLTVEGVNGF